MGYARWLLVMCASVCFASPPQADSTFTDKVHPFLTRNCFGCHNAKLNTGGLNLEAYTTPASVAKDRETWELVLQKLRNGEMPPKGLPRPAAPELAVVEAFIQAQFARADGAAKPFAGRVTARRLNRAEYNNTVRDLLGVDFRPADDFPQDDTGYGFDTIGDALSLSPVLMEKYLAAAERIARTAIFGMDKITPTVVRHQPPYREGTDGGNNSRFLAALPYTITDYDLTGLTLPSSLHAMHTFPAEGDYEFRIDPEGNRPRPSEPFPVAVWIDGKQVATVPFESTTNPTGMEGLDQLVTLHVPAGEHWVAVSALRQFEGLPAKYGGLNPTKQTEPDPPPVNFGGRGGRGGRNANAGADVADGRGGRGPNAGADPADAAAREPDAGSEPGAVADHGADVVAGRGVRPADAGAELAGVAGRGGRPADVGVEPAGVAGRGVRPADVGAELAGADGRGGRDPNGDPAFAGRGGAPGRFGGAGRAARPPQITDMSFRVNFVEISGPFHPVTAPSPESLKKIFVCHDHTTECERRVIGSLARRAYRRPVTPREVASLASLAANDRQHGGSWDESIGVALEAMLVSPSFLFRVEHDPAPGPDGDPTHAISPLEVASRLSYFLWSSMPDEDLLRAAEQNTLRNPVMLEAQVRRMLRDPKASRLVENFGGQWLQFRAIETVQPDPVRFMAFNDYLRLSMKRETEMFFEDLLAHDGSITEFLNGKYSFLNEELAQYYGIAGVKGPEFRRVNLEGTHRGGVLTQGSVLTASSYATRTSVVLRGKWVLDNLLNAPVPPPPPDVPALDEAAVGTSMSLRQQMEKHRANAICASCHARMDPLGFGLENFDAIGRWRDQDGKFPVDASGVLPDGKSFNGPDELKAILVSNRDAFARGLAEKMMIYALGRGVDAEDRPVIDAIAQQAARSDYRISSIVLGIVKSVPFQERKGDRSQP